MKEVRAHRPHERAAGRPGGVQHRLQQRVDGKRPVAVEDGGGPSRPRSAGRGGRRARPRRQPCRGLRRSLRRPSAVLHRRPRVDSKGRGRPARPAEARQAGGGPGQAGGHLGEPGDWRAGAAGGGRGERCRRLARRRGFHGPERARVHASRKCHCDEGRVHIAHLPWMAVPEHALGAGLLGASVAAAPCLPELQQGAVCAVGGSSPRLRATSRVASVGRA